MAAQNSKLPTISITNDDSDKIEFIDNSLTINEGLTVRQRKNRRNKKREVVSENIYQSNAKSEKPTIKSDKQRSLSSTDKPKKVTTKAFSAKDFNLLSQMFSLKSDEVHGDGLTDLEDLYATDEEDNLEDSEENEYDNDDDVLEYMNEDGHIEISDKIQRSQSPCHSESSKSNIISTNSKKKQAKNKILKKQSKLKNKNVVPLNQLSPQSISPHLSDITDTEIIYSDSDDEKNEDYIDYSNQHSYKRVNRNYLGKVKKDKKYARDLFNLNIKQGYSLPDLDYKLLSLAEPSVTVISDKPIGLSSESDFDTENEILDISKAEDSSAIPPRSILYKLDGKRNKIINSEETDIENFDSSESNEDLKIQNTFKCIHKKISCNKQRLESNLKLRNNEKVNIQLQTNRFNDHENKEKHNFHKILEQSLGNELPHDVKFVEVNGKVRSIFSTDNKFNSESNKLFLPQVESTNTDVEDLHSSYESESEVEDKILDILTIPTPTDNAGSITDTEFVEGEDDENRVFRPKTPEPPEFDNSLFDLHEPVRELVLLKEDHDGKPITIVLPLGDVEPEGLSYKFLDDQVSELEEMASDSADEGLLTQNKMSTFCVTPDLPDLDGGIVEESEIIKMGKKKLKPSNAYSKNKEPITDTEDIYLSVVGKRKKNQQTSTEISINGKQSKLVVTDIEDLDLSETEGSSVIVIENNNTESDAVSVIETELDASDEDNMENNFKSVTPDCMQYMICDTVTSLKESNEPLSLENKEIFLNYANSIPSIFTISATPDLTSGIMTDTDEMFTSAEEDGYSRADTATPLENDIVLDEHTSVVHVKHTQVYDFDAPAEAIHLKSHRNLNDNLTDVEELGFSEDDQLRVLNNVFVNETEDRICVCVNSVEKESNAACICITKEDSVLSLHWSERSPMSGGEDWASKSSTPQDPKKLERDEIQTENSEALESSSATDKPSSSGESGPAPSQGLPQTKK